MTTLQDIMGLITKRKIKIPTDNDYIISAAYKDIYERLKPQPKMETNLLTLGAIKAYIGNGSQGPPGAAATITIGTTTTGAAGTLATVTNTGTSSAAIFNFTIPEGAQGPQGAQGQQGNQGEQGVPGPQGIPGSEASCPDHIIISQQTGYIDSVSPNDGPTSDKMYIGNDPFGLYGTYNLSAVTDNFRNITAINAESINCGVPIPVNLNVGDTVKICGIAYIIKNPVMEDPKFHITVSHFSCSDVNLITEANVNTFTVIPVSTYNMSQKNAVCFSEEIVLTEIFPACKTFFVVGLNVTDAYDFEDAAEKECKFSYTLEVTKACIPSNLLIRNCCDPAFSEVIINNEVPVGSSFVDNEGNCWSVEAETLNGVTGVRTKVSEYSECSVCIAANPCPENFLVVSCCESSYYIFSGALPGLDVGDTFVDTNGFCWYIEDTSSSPISYVVTVATSYPGTDCEVSGCDSENPCPTIVELLSCCDLGYGYTTLEILQAAVPSLGLNDTFVDTFGFCWRIFYEPGEPYIAFTNLSFITPVTEEGDCRWLDGCLVSNPCPVNLYYTVQNCCTEEIEVLILSASYNMNNILTLQLTTGYGCYKILSWSDTGIVTATVVDVFGVHGNCEDCQDFNERESINEQYYCPGQHQCCNEYRNESEAFDQTITGYRCDGTWIVDFVIPPFTGICMALVISKTNNIFENGCCVFDVLNPSESVSITVTGRLCPGNFYLPEIVIPPGTLLSTVLISLDYSPCVTCVTHEIENDNDFLYVECNPVEEEGPVNEN